MAMSVSLVLNANGSQIEGDSTIHSLDRENAIECLYFSDDVETAREASTGMATGDRTYKPIEILKRIDRASPLLFKALVDNEVIDGVFRFFRPSPEGDGTTQHFYTIEIWEGRVARIKRVSPNTIDPAKANEPPLERVSFVFGKIRHCHEDGGQEHEDHWSQRS